MIGMAAKKRPDGEEIRNVCPVPSDPKARRRYESSLEAHLFPPPEGLRIDIVNVEGGDVVLIDVPPQPEELKPFLVHGAVVDGKLEGAFISIVRRRGDSSIPITAAAIHTTLTAGRALLRRGHVDSDDGSS